MLIEKAAAKDPLGHITVFFLNTGLRAGELCNLTWRDYYPKVHGIKIETSKTKAGHRFIPLIPEAEEILLSQPYCCDYVFTSTKKTQVTKTVLRKLYVRLQEATGIYVTNHIYRHTFATRMVEARADYKALSQLLGHTDVAFTLNRYPRLHLDFLRSQINLLSRKPSVQTGALPAGSDHLALR